MTMPAESAPPADAASAPAHPNADRPFLGLIDVVTLRERGEFAFDGAVAAEDVAATWTWVLRDLASDLIDPAALRTAEHATEALDALLPELLERARMVLDGAAADAQAERRLMAQLGGEHERVRMPFVLNALRHHKLIERAQGFGRAANAMTDDSALLHALQSIPGGEQPAIPFVMFALVGQIATPLRLMTVAVRVSGGASDADLAHAGLAPLLDAMLAHAQNQIPVLTQVGTFTDMDMVCRAVDRFHRLMRAVTGLVELNRTGAWAHVAAGLTRQVSARLEPRLRDVVPDLNKSLRKRDGVDRADADQILTALNGMYLLATVRDCRESLALNTMFEQVWTQTGQALEIHIDRLLDGLRANPRDAHASARLDAALKMAELRFGPDYAETLRRAKSVTERRVSSAS